MFYTTQIQGLHCYAGRFKTRGIRDSGSKEDEGDTVYLLAKELAYDVLTDQTEKLAAALAKVSGKDIVAFAQALKASDSKIDEKICGNDSNFATSSTASQCRNGSGTTYKGLAKFADASITSTGQNWPKGNSGTHDNANDVAGDMIKLPKDDKAIVAGHLAKSIEGGEVVEIRSVSSTLFTDRYVSSNTSSTKCSKFDMSNTCDDAGTCQVCVIRLLNMYQALLEPDHQSPQGFGLLLILNDIGDPKKTLQDKLVWLKGETMISRAPSGPGYKVWVFSCTQHGGSEAHHRYRGRFQGLGPNIWTIVNTEVGDGGKLLGYWTKHSQQKSVKLHLVDSDLKNIDRNYWHQSKTGEVNVTGFRPKKKLALAKYLAKTVEGGKVVKIRSVSSIMRTAVFFMNTLHWRIQFS